MNLKRQIGMLVALTAGSLALAAPALGASPDRMRDAHDRAVAPGDAAVAYFRANELATLPASSRVQTFREYLDGPERGGASQTGSSDIVAIPGDGFDWRAAAIGASSALMLFLVAVVGVVVARHSRARPLVH